MKEGRAEHKEDFFERVKTQVQRIPCGKVTTYGAIAEKLSSRSAARTVGWALNSCINEQIDIPCHRVVNRNGELTGQRYFPGDTMRSRLMQEGISFTEDGRVEMKIHFWNP